MAGAQGVVITTDVPVVGRAAVPVYVDESLPMEGGPARAVQVVTSGPMAGGAPRAVRLAPAGTPTVGPALPIYIVSGILDVLAYASKVKAVAPSNLLAYWPLGESSGTTIVDESGNGRNGVYTGVDLGQPGIGDGRTCPFFDGVNDYGNVFGASLAAAFSATEGSFGMWIKVSAAGVWADGVTRRYGVLQADANNKILMQKVAGANTLQPNHVSNTVSKSQAITTSSTAWMHSLMTWSTAADQVCHYYNGALQGTPGTSIGTWVGALTVAVIGANDTVPANAWSGNIAHVALWNAPLSAAQVAQLATVP